MLFLHSQFLYMLQIWKAAVTSNCIIPMEKCLHHQIMSFQYFFFIFSLSPHRIFLFDFWTLNERRKKKTILKTQKPNKKWRKINEIITFFDWLRKMTNEIRIINLFGFAHHFFFYLEFVSSSVCFGLSCWTFSFFPLEISEFNFCRKKDSA